MIYYIWSAVFLKRVIMFHIKSVERLLSVRAYLSVRETGITGDFADILTKRRTLSGRLFDNIKYIAGKK